MSTVALLKAGRARVATGWVQHTSVSADGRKVCAIGGLTMSIEARDHMGSRWSAMDFHPANRALLLAIGELDPGWPTCCSGCMSVPRWNDTPGRTQEQVLEVYDRAIKIAERDDL